MKISWSNPILARLRKSRCSNALVGKPPAEPDLEIGPSAPASNRGKALPVRGEGEGSGEPRGEGTAGPVGTVALRPSLAGWKEKGD